MQGFAQMKGHFSLTYSTSTADDCYLTLAFLKLWMEKEVESDHLRFKEGYCIIMQPTISSNMEN